MVSFILLLGLSVVGLILVGALVFAFYQNRSTR